MENRPQFYQGDVLLEYMGERDCPVDSKVSEGRLVIARGERTGHTHTVDAKDAVLSDDGMYLWVSSPTEMTHPEHPPLSLNRLGMYAIILQRRYMPEDTKRVID